MLEELASTWIVIVFSTGRPWVEDRAATTLTSAVVWNHYSLQARSFSVMTPI